MLEKFNKIAGLAMLLAFVVVVLGAWVRLSHAGLGCPDWPGCYGKLTWPTAEQELASANEAFPDRPVEISKAWKEMVHRYLAGALVLLVVALNWLAWRSADRHVRAMRGMTAVLLALIVAQALLGMWTVTLKLKPLIVMLHLLGGMTTFALLVWLWQTTRSASDYSPGKSLQSMRRWVTFGLVVLALQIALGGWTSANYAALVCPDLPTCMGQWLPRTNFTDGFVLWRGIGVDYEGGVLDLPSRVAIHLSHRIGAVVTLITLWIVALRLARVAALQRLAVLLAILVTAQFVIGLLNIALRLPLPIAVAHNGVAALLLALLVSLLYRTTPARA